MDPIVQAGHEGVVHHIVVYECRDDYPDHHLNITGQCYSPDMPPPAAKCAGATAIAAWAIGGNVGFMPLLVNQAQFVIEFHSLNSNTLFSFDLVICDSECGGAFTT